MRRTSLLLLVAVAACANFKDTFTSHRDTAAEAGGLKLAPDTLARILAGPRGLRLTKDAATFVANLWVDYALFAEAAADGKLPTDSASAAAALWPEVAELRTQHWHDSITAKREQPSPAAVDSLYNGDDVRVFQHILIGTPRGANAAAKAAARKKAEATLAKLKGGADFGKLAGEVSDDPGSKADQGFLPPSPRGRFVPAFDSAGWALAPGAMTGLVESPFGYHIIKRPTAAAVQGRLTLYLGQRSTGKADSTYMEDLAKTNGVEVAKTAPADMKAAALNPDASLKSGKTLVSFKGGGLTVAEYLRWVHALPPQYAAQLKQANDTALSQFARVLALNVLLLRQADSAKVKLTAPEWQSIYERYTTSIDSLKQDMGFSGPDSAAAKKDVAPTLGSYFDKLVAGQLRIRPMPGTLATLLRDHARYRVNDAGVNRALELALAESAKRDSAEAKAPALQPAPGGPPVPGGAPEAPSTPDTGKGATGARK